MANIVDRDDARVVEPGQGAGLAQELLDIVGAGDAPGAGDFDGHGSVEVIVPGEVDAPEASLAEPPHDPVAADDWGIAPRKLVRCLSRRYSSGIDLDQVHRLVRRRIRGAPPRSAARGGVGPR